MRQPWDARGHEATHAKGAFFTIKILIAAFVVYLVVMSSITAYVYRQPDDLLRINYVCTTHLYPNSFAAYRMYDNGTHTIDMDSCKWIKNADPKLASAEYDWLYTAYCSEIMERHESGEPYIRYSNEVLAESRVAGCVHVGLG